MIYDALATLASKRPFELIKVSELVEEAQVGRATFYRNFDAIEDVLRWRCDQVVDGFIVYALEYMRSQPKDSIIPFLKPVLRYFDLHSAVVELLIEAKRVDILQASFQKRIRIPRLITLKNTPEKFLDYGAVIRSSVVVSILANWVQNGKKESPDELAEGLGKMMLEMSGMGILF